jgi:hypothetical protein
MIARFAPTATKLLLASGTAIFAIFFLVAFLHPNEGADVAGRTALGGFEFAGAAASLYLLSKGKLDKISLLDWLCSAFAILMACFGFTGSSITLFAFYLLVRDRHDLNTRGRIDQSMIPAPSGRMQKSAPSVPGRAPCSNFLLFCLLDSHVATVFGNTSRGSAVRLHGSEHCNRSPGKSKPIISNLWSSSQILSPK